MEGLKMIIEEYILYVIIYQKKHTNTYIYEIISIL